jgi:hypothetical protein
VTAAGWRCDACGELVSSVEDGLVEWLAGEDARGRSRCRGLRIVHHRCRYDEHLEFTMFHSVVEGLPLERFLGADGLILLASLIEAGELPPEELLEVTKRVQVPGYEQGREWFEEAIAARVVEPSIGIGYYLQTEIQAMLRWASEARSEKPA